MMTKRNETGGVSGGASAAKPMATEPGGASGAEPGADSAAEPGGDSVAEPGADSAAARERAYRGAAAITRAQLRRDAPEQARVLDEVERSDVVVVTGAYDRVQQVLDALAVPHTVIDPPALDHVVLRPEQLLVINCPGQVSSHAIARIRAFVKAGGSLFTTDWALRHVIEPAFPEILAHNERPTLDDVVRIEAKDPDNIYLQGVMDGQDDPQWCLEASSYPIRILDPERVEVLITSKELGEKYGETPVAVWFRWGEGEVFHMISHYYLQRTELRTARHMAPAESYFVEKGVTMDMAMRADVGDHFTRRMSSEPAASLLFPAVYTEPSGPTATARKPSSRWAAPPQVLCQPVPDGGNLESEPSKSPAAVVTIPHTYAAPPLLTATSMAVSSRPALSMVQLLAGSTLES